MRITRYSLMRGEVIRKEKLTPSGMPASRNPKNIGIDEQEQNGVTAPKSAAKKFPAIPFWLIHFLILFWGKKVRATPITKIKTKSKRRILIES